MAIKVLSPSIGNLEASQNSGSVEQLAIRFEREAKLVSQLKSPYTVTMYDYGRTSDDLLYMVLEHVDGVTLGDAAVPMSPERTAKILKQVLKSLQEAHNEGLLHRDLKPEVDRGAPPRAQKLPGSDRRTDPARDSAVHGSRADPR